MSVRQSICTTVNQNHKPTVSIRPATIKDAEQMANVFVTSVKTLNIKDYTAEQIAIMATFCDARSYLAAIKTGNESIFVAEAEAVVGFASLAEGGGHIDDLFVHPDYTRRGVATLLLQTLERIALQKQKSRLSVMASLTARPFYLSRGFKEIKNSQLIDRETGIIIPGVDMVKILSSDSS